MGVALRPICLEDAAEFVRLLGADEASVMQMARMPWPLDEGGARSWLRQAGVGESTYAVLSGSAEVFAGCVGFWPVRGEGGGVCEIGYWIGRPYRNGGLASTAVARVIAIARKRGVECLRGLVRPGNAASRRVLEGNGFAYLGDVRRNQPLRGGMRTLALFERELPSRLAPGLSGCEAAVAEPVLKRSER